MGRSVHRLRVAHARRVNHPVFHDVEKHYFLVRAKDVPPGIRADANARPAEGINRQVYRDVCNSLLCDESIPGSFDLMNKGITILADEVKKVDDTNYELVVSDGLGIVDGGHTYRIISENLDNPELDDNQYVEIQVRTGIRGSLIVDIAKGLNSGIQVKLHSLANLDGAFDWLKDEIAGESYSKLIAWREGDDGEYDVRDLICVLEALNVLDFPNNKPVHPIQAYEKWSGPAAKFAEDARESKKNPASSRYRKLRPLLKGGLNLFDRIRHDFREIHNEAGGSAGLMRIIEQARGDNLFDFPFAKLPRSEYRLTKGATFPIFAAFRNAVSVDKKSGEALWTDGFDSTLELWEEAGPELVAETYGATKDIGHLPDQIGKSRGHWANLHKTLELRMLRRQLAKRR